MIQDVQNNSKKYKWAAFRIFSYVGGSLAVLSCGTLFYIFAPVTSLVFFDSPAFWKHVRHFHKIFFTCVLFARNCVTSPATGYRIILHLTAPPMIGPDPEIATISPTWPSGVDDCRGCHTCCDKFGCSLIGEKGGCICYGSPFWRYFNCGRFPENKEQLKFYGCPKWIC